MLLLIIRHAIAEDKVDFAKTGQSDDLRPLTDEGRDRMAVGSRGLRSIVGEISVLATSPLTRAVQTAEIVAKAYERSIDETIDALRGESRYEDLLEWLMPHSSKKTIAVVGHEPHLTGLTSWLISGRTDAAIDLKKGAACLLDLSAKPAKGKATLLWSITPAQLRALAPSGAG